MKTSLTLTILVLLLHIAACSHGQTRITPCILDLVGRIEARSTYESQFVGFAGISEQYRLYDSLQRSSTKQELWALVSHRSPAVRLYAFKALCTRYPALAHSAINTLKTDTASINTLEGCLAGRSKVAVLARRISADTVH